MKGSFRMEDIEPPFFKIKALTIRQCMDKGIRRVYDPNWLERNCYLKLPLKVGDKYPLWLELYSDETQAMMGIDTPQKLPITSLIAGLDSICLEYNGEISKKDKDENE
jgi:hypothetical protein